MEKVTSEATLGKAALTMGPDSIEAEVRGRIRGWIEELVEAELTTVLGAECRPVPADAPRVSAWPSAAHAEYQSWPHGVSVAARLGCRPARRRSGKVRWSRGISGAPGAAARGLSQWHE
jgi:hypothetical protein